MPPLRKTPAPYNTHEDYFATVSPEARVLLESIQAEVERNVPGAARCIGYNMPAFRQVRIFFYFAAFRKHIGIYPPVTGDEKLVIETARYRGDKGNLSFPLDEPLPVKLIGRVAAALARQYAAR